MTAARTASTAERGTASIWRDSTGDADKLRLLEDYIRDAREGRLVNRTITLLDDARGMRIVDGNKRAIAIYETTADDVTVPVFMLRPRAI